jgi:predicted lipid carrier protein YhbT
VPEFLSPEWIEALDRSAGASDALGGLVTEAILIVEQVVTDVPGRGEVRYRFEVGPSGARVRSEGAAPASVTITVPYETAVGINAGKESAQAAFMAGRLRLGGDVTVLLSLRDSLAGLDDVFAAVRAETSY